MFTIIQINFHVKQFRLEISVNLYYWRHNAAESGRYDLFVGSDGVFAPLYPNPPQFAMHPIQMRRFFIVVLRDSNYNGKGGPNLKIAALLVILSVRTVIGDEIALGFIA